MEQRLLVFESPILPQREGESQRPLVENLEALEAEGFGAGPAPTATGGGGRTVSPDPAGLGRLGQNDLAATLAYSR
ncbi:MAG: hypothetical protein A2600_07470 [Candidatus Lambdaproteobacteria bacterium RIFOXYD1_FULL_56_27]|uniref:Uncharacterized protein n=1 Tax=Candidatus Lambdaproteobacteria bacterium RIFOXYD2_FULL_56_26 TaxID=1817773 RepID=A0A1F6GVM3_9PROT|nr:MAG: hypothetical protein A2557_05275 [Candidatus Lambdaproteobacteria bacterium RIFOXYD2_FULL_56_26]OGH03768.1 MAG: hypothetical protein A2426_00920 [Candidatus Lambdaproteobacteria bacterium RIFOXYC1_FULL_56_13]OGH07352.1 MAG: hypothetical protein A2600_07470 [Candidatus Lambdaproteobacteria bacterium RIFOXYD1_FULL_56_27]